MDFSWSDDQMSLKNAVLQFAAKELDSDVISRDKEGRFPLDLWKKCAEFGVQGLYYPAEFGGQGLDLLTTLLVMETLGYACKDGGLLFALGAQMWSVQSPIHAFGTDEQKSKYLAGMCRGEMIGAHAMSEPDSGSDAFSMKTTATRDGEHYILNGSKTFVSNAPSADFFVAFATIDPKKGFMGVTGFLIDKDTPGLKVGAPISKLGLRTSPFSELFFNDCRVPAENRLGQEGAGSTIFNHSMEYERGCILAPHVGAMERQLETCISYARERAQFNRPIGKFQSISNKIADMKTRLETARLLLYKMGWTKMTKGRAPIEAAVAKLQISESWIKSCLDAVQIHGGYGYTTEYELERDLRDSIGGTLYSGTSEIQRSIIAQFLGL